MSEWKNVQNEKDIEELLNAYNGFHDSCIASLNFQSGTYVDNNYTMHFDGYKKYELHIIFNSQWYPKDLELCFNGLRRLNLVGVQDNYMNDICEASIKFYDKLLPSKYQVPERVIVWADCEDFDANAIDLQLGEPADTYVIAHTLKWRFIDK
ncbi:MAG: hypothetical protein K2N23_06845 [Clostridia bacterium]|nr:hypothetical protein [Clostridia bacterium]